MHAEPLGLRGAQVENLCPRGTPLKSDWVLLMTGDPDPETVISHLDRISCESTASGCSCVSSA